jgi:RNA recognition motif-containing protein
MSRQIESLNEVELSTNLIDSGSWHDQFRQSPFIFIGSIPYELNEGDLFSIFSQYPLCFVYFSIFRYGEVVDAKICRDRDTGKSKGYAFLQYFDSRSAVLAVDNFNGIQV